MKKEIPERVPTWLTKASKVVLNLALALAVLLVLTGCVGGETASEMTEEVADITDGKTTTEIGAEPTTDATTGEAPQTTIDGGPKTSTGTESGALSEKDVFEAYGVGVNYSAGGDLDASAVVRSHLVALDGADSLTASSVSRTETGSHSTVISTFLERDGDRSLFRTEGAGPNVFVFHGEDVSVMRTVSDGDEHYAILGGANDSAEQTDAVDPESAVVLELSKLQLLPYEEVGTVTRNGTTLTKYEATGPGYYASDEVAGDVSVESYNSTVLVGEDGLVRLFHQKVVVERGGETVTKAVTVRYEDVGTTTVTKPDWVENATDETT
jgi:outer membrane lipoprotein-sorting protein